MKSSKHAGLKGLAAALALAGSFAFGIDQAHAAATIIINNINAAGVGFNDTTPAAPVGGNTGTTLGEQRLIAFTYAANIWGATLTSAVPIVINAQFSALTCTATSATLGSAGATSIFRDFAGAPLPATWYSYALANKIAGSYLGTLNAAQINANFNVNLGTTGCLTGTFWYYGLDSNHGANIDFVAVLQHEMAHGLGFQTFTNGSTGAQNGGFPSVWDAFLYGSASGKLWKDMTNAERAASSLSGDKLVWTGANVLAAVPNVLRFGAAGATISGPAAGVAAGNLLVGEASFGPPLGSPALVGEIMPVVEADNSLSLACDPLTGNNARAVAGKVALVSRGTCGFVVKVKNAQDAGAIAVLVGDNVAGTPPAGLGGTDPTIVIPSVRITLDDTTNLREALKRRSRTSSGVFVSLGLLPMYAGADSAGRAKMYAPNPYQSGSSVSHYDTSMFRNQLMEPAINGDLTQSVMPPEDMTLPLFKDIGW